jgi:hypothetical protein
MRHLLLFLALAAQAFSQSMPAREVRLRLLAFDNTSIPEHAYAHDPAMASAPGVEAPIKGYLNHESVALRLTGNDVIFSSSAAAHEAGRAEFQLAKATLPNAGRDFLLIFLPIGEQKFRVLPLDDSTKEFPLGSHRIVNLSSSSVRLMLEKKPFPLKPGQISIITDPPVQANQHSAMYAFKVAHGKEQRIGSGLWPHPGQKRSIQLFFDNHESGQTELRGFRDISPPVPNSPATPQEP